MTLLGPVHSGTRRTASSSPPGGTSTFARRSPSLRTGPLSAAITAPPDNHADGLLELSSPRPRSIARGRRATDLYERVVAQELSARGGESSRFHQRQNATGS